MLIKKFNINFIFLSSDDYNSFEELKKKFPNLKIIRKTIPEKNIRNLHYCSKNKKKQIYESIRDIYFILKSNYFIPSINSGFSFYVTSMINKKNNLFDECIFNYPRIF